jgi:hypothetical protein
MKCLLYSLKIEEIIVIPLTYLRNILRYDRKYFTIKSTCIENESKLSVSNSDGDYCEHNPTAMIEYLVKTHTCSPSHASNKCMTHTNAFDPSLK